MLERRTARSAAAKPKASVTTAAKAKPTGAKAAAQPAPAKPAAKRIDEMREYIQRRAYELWESEGRPTGRDQAHWLQAEREIARVRGQRAGLTR
jgi:hypothetical protein